MKRCYDLPRCNEELQYKTSPWRRSQMLKASKRSRIGLREIANLAQASVATVSRVLNGNTRVDPALRKRVLESAAQLNIDVSGRNKTKALAFLLSNRTMLHAFHSVV